jgi:hypothetical protein
LKISLISELGKIAGKILLKRCFDEAQDKRAPFFVNLWCGIGVSDWWYAFCAMPLLEP